MDDELLVIRCQLGERDAFAELVHLWHVPVWTFVRRMLDEERADDVAQEVWVAVLRGLPRLAGPDRFAPWLFTCPNWRIRRLRTALRSARCRPARSSPACTAHVHRRDA